MNNKIKTIIVILCTIICVSIMLFSDKISNKANDIRDKVLVIGKKSSLHNRNFNLNNQNSSIEKNEAIQRNEQPKKIGIEGTQNKSSNDVAIKKNIASSSAMTEKYKKLKMNVINDQLQQDKEEFFYQDNSEYNKGKENNQVNTEKNSAKQIKEGTQQEQDNKSVNSKDSLSGKDIPVFKVSKSKISENLTFSDKAKLLSVASKLSAIDYEKINKYLGDGSEQSVKSAIKLLKERLSEKDYDKVKEVAQKFINMDVVEQ